MDYTILGAEANLAARLQSIAPRDSVVVRHETYALASDIVTARALPAISIKGFNREVVPCRIEGIRGADDNAVPVFSETGDGLNFYLDLGRMDSARSAHVRQVLTLALAALEQHQPHSCNV